MNVFAYYLDSDGLKIFSYNQDLKEWVFDRPNVKFGSIAFFPESNIKKTSDFKDVSFIDSQTILSLKEIALSNKSFKDQLFDKDFFVSDLEYEVFLLRLLHDTVGINYFYLEIENNSDFPNPFIELQYHLLSIYENFNVLYQKNKKDSFKYIISFYGLPMSEAREIKNCISSVFINYNINLIKNNILNSCEIIDYIKE